MDAIDRWLDDAELAPAPLDTHDADVVVLGEMNHFVNEKSDFRLALASPLVERGYDVWGEELGWSDGTSAIVPRVHHDYRQACMGECGNQRGLIAPGRLDDDAVDLRSLGKGDYCVDPDAAIGKTCHCISIVRCHIEVVPGDIRAKRLTRKKSSATKLHHGLET